MENGQDELGRELERSKLLWIRYGLDSDQARELEGAKLLINGAGGWSQDFL